MPNILGLSKASTYVKGMMGAGAGKATANKVVSSAKKASGVMSHGKNMNISKYAMQNKGKTAAMGAAAFGATQLVSRRRGPGVSKTPGRPTGMYKY